MPTATHHAASSGRSRGKSADTAPVIRIARSMCPLGNDESNVNPKPCQTPLRCYWMSSLQITSMTIAAR